MLDRWFNVLLVSCFYQGEDVQGVAGTVISELKGAAQPHLTLLVGDQVYLDLPTQVIFPAEPDRLADKFEADYRRNWAGPGGFGQVLAAAPSACIPDDHEYWNNFPNATPVVANTWTAGGRAAWQLAARQLFEGFQRSYDGQLGDAFTLDVAPLSFFLADGRTFRDPDRRFMLSRAGRDQLDAWAQGRRGLRDIRGALRRIGEEVEHGAVVPERDMGIGKIERGDVADAIAHVQREWRRCESLPCKRKRGVGEIVQRELAEAASKQVVDQRRGAGADIEDRCIAVESQRIDEGQRSIEMRPVPTHRVRRFRRVHLLPM